MKQLPLEKRMEIIAALKATPNASHVYKSVGKRIGVSYASVWNIAAAEGIELAHIAYSIKCRRLGVWKNAQHGASPST